MKILPAARAGDVSDGERTTGQWSAEALAYLGDAVLELGIRVRQLSDTDNVATVHHRVVARVRGDHLATVMATLWEELDEAETAVAKRARNAQPTRRGSFDPQVRSQSQALEALIGYLFLEGRSQRLESIVDRINQM